MKSCEHSKVSYCSTGEGNLEIFHFDNGQLKHKSINNDVHTPYAELDTPTPLIFGVSTCTWGSGRIDMVGVGTSYNVLHRYYNGSSWSSWTDLQGATTEPPTICTWGSGRLDIFVLGTDNAVWQRSFSSGNWGSWTSIEGEFVFGPSATSPGSGIIDVFAIDSDGYLNTRHFNSTWGDWCLIEGRLKSAPVATSLGDGKIDLFGVGDYGAIWHKWYDKNWTSLKYFGGKDANTPTVVPIGNKCLRLCYIDKKGATNIRTWNGKSWSDWQCPEKTSVGGHKTERAPKKVIPKQDLLPWIVTQKSVVFGLNDFKNMLIAGKSFQQLLLSKADDFIVYFTRLVISNGQKSIRNWFKGFFLKKVENVIKPVTMAKVQKILENTQNHIKNSSVAKGFDEWNVIENGGVIVEEIDHALPSPRKKKQKAFSGSYAKSKLMQSVAAADMQVLKETNFKCQILAGAYINARPDCGSYAKVTLQAINDMDEVIKELNNEYQDLLFPFNGVHTYKYSVLKIDDPEIISKAVKFNLFLETHDNRGWAGNFGSKFTDMFIRAVPTNLLI
jgi:hypothetical protein